ncbi:hypothetical protein DCAR_0312725 [Daucus carota subsp. sativus]|uniref:Uncharacterized protein n=1 Tax=Daucus carota subsp. sativus TaxID=79200 RepID=A0A166B8S2_DAUCS|nr:hypothetical protein DCAR_0312725 [Daucus carota subsp. sativus]
MLGLSDSPTMILILRGIIYSRMMFRQLKMYQQMILRSKTLSPEKMLMGSAGVGKTRMMEEIWKGTKEENITRADVGNEKLDVIQLQNQIAI